MADDGQLVVDVHPVGTEGQLLAAVALLPGDLAAVFVVEGALEFGQFVGGDGQQSALLGGDGAGAVGGHVVQIDEGVAGRGVEGEAVVQSAAVHGEFAVHHPGVAVELVDARDDGGGVGAFAADFIPSGDVARVVGAIGHHDLVLVGLVGGEVAGVALQARAPREAGEARGAVAAHDVLTGEYLCLGVSLAEFLPRGRRHAGGGHHEVHQVGHHHTVRLHAHAACGHVGTQQPRAVGGRRLAGLDLLVGQILQQQGVGVALEAGLGGVGGDLVVEEQAPVVAVGHGQFAVGQSQPVEHVVHHFLIVVLQGGGVPLLVGALEQLQRQSGFAQLLHHDVLVRGVEEVVVLQRPVAVEVVAFVEIGPCGVVVPQIDLVRAGGVVAVGVAVDGEEAHALKPLFCQRVVGEQTQRGGQHVGFPAVFLGLRVAGVARGHAAIELIVAFGLQQSVYVALLILRELVPLEEGGIGHRHGPEAALPDGIAGGGGAPIVIARAHLQLVGLVGGVGIDQTLHGVFLQQVVRDARGQADAFGFGVFHQEGGDHREVGVRTHALLAVGARGGVAVFRVVEEAAALALAVGRGALEPVVLHVGGEPGQHLQEVFHHLVFGHEGIVDLALRGRIHVTLRGVGVGCLAGDVEEAHVVQQEAGAGAVDPVELKAQGDALGLRQRELHAEGGPLRGDAARVHRDDGVLARGHEFAAAGGARRGALAVHCEAVFGGRQRHRLLHRGAAVGPGVADVVHLRPVGGGARSAQIVVGGCCGGGHDVAHAVDARHGPSRQARAHGGGAARGVGRQAGGQRLLEGGVLEILAGHVDLCARRCGEGAETHEEQNGLFHSIVCVFGVG